MDCNKIKTEDVFKNLAGMHTYSRTTSGSPLPDFFIARPCIFSRLYMYPIGAFRPKLFSNCRDQLFAKCSAGMNPIDSAEHQYIRH